MIFVSTLSSEKHAASLRVTPTNSFRFKLTIRKVVAFRHTLCVCVRLQEWSLTHLYDSSPAGIIPLQYHPPLQHTQDLVSGAKTLLKSFKYFIIIFFKNNLLELMFLPPTPLSKNH